MRRICQPLSTWSRSMNFKPKYMRQAPLGWCMMRQFCPSINMPRTTSCGSTGLCSCQRKPRLSSSSVMRFNLSLTMSGVRARTVALST